MGHSWDALGDSWMTFGRLLVAFGTKKLLKRSPGRDQKSCFFENSDFSRFVGGRRATATSGHRKSIHFRLQNHPEIEVVSIFTPGCSFSLPWDGFWTPLDHFWILFGHFWDPRVPQEPPKSAQEQPRAPPRAPQEHPTSSTRAPMSTPRVPQSPPGGSQDAPRAPKCDSRTQNDSKTVPQGPKMVPKSTLTSCSL